MKPNEYIICSAIHVQNGKEYPHQPQNIESGIVICGRRHHNCWAVIEQLPNKEGFHPKTTPMVQGFLTSFDRFVDRREAKTIALNASQIDKDDISILASEDLY